MRDRRVPKTSLALMRARRGKATPIRAVHDAAADRLVALTSRILGDDLDARLSRLLRRPNEAGFDPFGADLFTMRTSLACVAYLYRWYFRAQSYGIEHVPDGRVLLVANHGGQLPIDGMMIATAMVLDAEPPRFARSMIEKWVATLPFLSVWFPRVGQIVGSPENAQRLLEREEALVVFPEGVRGVGKTFDKRYQLERFGLGFMRLALQTKAPIVPVAVIGSEEQYISVANLRSFGRFLGMPSLPVLPQLLLYPLPFPTKYRLHFGEPLRFNGDPDDDDAAIEERVRVVRRTLQKMVDAGLKRRTSIFW